MYRAAEGNPRKCTLAGLHGKVEILGRGQQFVAYGAHPTGAELGWSPRLLHETFIGKLTAVTEAQITAFLLAVAPMIGANPPTEANPPTAREPVAWIAPGAPVDRGAPLTDKMVLVDILDVMAALAVIPNDGPPDWEKWNNVGMAIWVACRGHELGFNAWCTWSAGHPSFDPDACWARWAHYPSSPPDRTGAGKLYAMAVKSWPGWQRPSEARVNRAVSALEDSNLPTLQHSGLDPVTQEQLPARPWAYGHFLMFGSVGVIGAVDGSGKSAIAVVMALAVITGRPLLGEKIWRSGPVGVVTYEDDEMEWHRRIAAACCHHDLDYASMLPGFRFIRKPGGRVSFASMTPGGTVFPDGEAIVEALHEIGAALLIIDPFNHAHDLDDGNNNAMIAKVAGEMMRIAQASKAAVLVLHHLRKGASGQADDLMGATSLRATFRSARILSRMTEDEATKLGIVENAWRYIRIAGTKENYAPPPDKATWFKLVSVPLNNASEVYPDGDSVAVATVWTPRLMFEGMDAAVFGAVFATLRQGNYSPNRNAKNTPWAGGVPMKTGGRSESEAKRIIAAWLEHGLLTKATYYHQNSRHMVEKVVLDEAKVAEIQATYTR